LRNLLLLGARLREESGPVTLEAAIEAAVEKAVARATAPLVHELQRIRAEKESEGVSLEEAAGRLRCSVRTVQRRIKDGTLPVVPGMRPPRVILGAVLTAANE
jgi:DNA-directed RNA polymerase specialized sigma24 family protein